MWKRPPFWWFVAAVIVTVMAVYQSPARAADGFEWKHFGADPYATTRTEAMQKRESAFRAMGLPTPVIKQLLQVTEKPGEKVRLVVGDHLSAMMSKGGVVHRDVTVAFSAPVRGMEYAAPAEKWEVFWQGRTFTVFLPEICFNWSFRVTDMTVTVAQSCATLNYTVEPGDEVRFAVLARKRLPASACWQLCDGTVCSAPPSPCDTCDWIGPKSVIPAGFEPLHTGLYVAQAAKQSLRFPREVMSEYIALCATRKVLGQSDSAVVMPPTWGPDATVTIPASGFPLWGPANIGRVVVPAAKQTR